MWIREERRTRGLSQAKLAKLVPLEQARLSAMELGKAPVAVTDEQQIRGAFTRFDRAVLFGDANKITGKTKWSKVHGGNVKRTRTEAISEGDVRKFVGTLAVLPDPAITMSSERPRALAFFAGCGGFSLGMRLAGVDVVGHIEIDDEARAIYASNFPTSRELGTDISIVDEKSTAQWAAANGPIDLIFGGPPCQGFSLTGKRDKTDPRNKLYRDYLRIAAEVRPRALIIENVRLLTSMKSASGAFVRDEILKDLADIGYHAKYACLNAQDYGAPQFRERVFFVAFRDKRDIDNYKFPAPTHGVPSVGTLFGSLTSFRTFRDATGNLAPLESGELDAKDPLHFAVEHPVHVINMLKGVSEGKSAHDNPDPALRPTSGYNTTYKRLCWDEPSSTIATTFGMISGSRNVHPSSTRSLTIREALRCQTFPDRFIVFGSIGGVRRAIGNAVPPRLAEAVGASVLSILGRARQVREKDGRRAGRSRAC